ncbi:MAG: chorismate-binding protein, partial [Myxococcota bacterium]|nr:chorismate-binding protein [Myxococcota bacterium]
MEEELQHIILYSSRSFNSIIDGFSAKEGLAIFELDCHWRICSWWDGEHIARSYTDLEGWLRFRKDGAYHFLPLIGGALGWIAYDQGIEGEDLPQKSSQIENMLFWSCSGAICYEITSGAYHIIGSKRFCDEAKSGFEQPSVKQRANAVSIPSPSILQKDVYTRSVQTLLEEIREGRVYQANLSWKSQTFHIRNPLAHYQKLQRYNPARFGAFLQFESHTIVSNSPELYLRAHKNQKICLESIPIKGTAVRSREGKEQLWTSEKEKAELTMIVDLVRNDLGRVAEVGSIHTHHRAIRRCGDLYHAEQKIHAQLKEERSLIDAIRATFPPGSITGAPKIAAMKLIYELEPHARGI